MAGGFEPLHDPLSSLRRLMRIFGTIVEPLVLAVLNLEPQAPARRAIGSELAGDQNTRSAGLFANELAHKPLSSPPVTMALDQGVKHEAVLIDGAPEPVLLAADRDDDLIQMPFVAEPGCDGGSSQ